MNKVDERFKEDSKNILENGFIDENPRPKYEDQSLAYSLSINQVIRKHDLSKDPFPIITLRPIAWKSAIKEMLWIFADESNSLELLHNKYGVKVWDEFESKDIPGTIGARYGETIHAYDLMNKLIKGLRENPFGRRHIIDLMKYEQLNKTDGLYPCAFCTIWSVRKVKNEDKLYLDMSLIQRSGDSACASSCGGWNEVQYAALMMMVAQCCDMKVGNFVHYVQNEQIYLRHKPQIIEMLERKSVKCFPILKLNPNKKEIKDFVIDDFELIDYPIDKIKKQNPQLKFEIAI